MIALIRIFALSLGVLFAGAAMAATPSLQEANQLFKQGKFQAALDQVEAYLASHPKEAKGRFLKGLLLAELNRTQEAIGVFTDLTVDYPELPGPYNNLAVLYAAQGQYEKARKHLEMAIRTHPSYATVHENLGDVYAMMASEAYDKALQLDKGNASAQIKLALIKDLFNPSAVSAGTKGKASKTMLPASESTQVALANKSTEGNRSKVPEDQVRGSEEPHLMIEKRLHAWAQAWSRRDVDAYLDFYAEDYKAPGKASRADWAEERRIRLTRPEYIKVELSEVKIEIEGKRAYATFRQQYDSNLLKATSLKRITFEKQGEAWKIIEEKVLEEH